MRRKPRLTFARHVEIANRLKAIRRELIDLWVELCHAYPKGSPCVTGLRRMMRLSGTFDLVRSYLDDQLALEYPSKFDPEIYHGEEKQDGPTRTTAPA